MKPKLKQLVPKSPLNQAENASSHLPLPQLCSTPSLPNDQFCVTSTAINSQSKNYTPVKREKTAAAASYTSTSYVTLHCRSQSVWAAVCCHNLFIRLQMSNFVKKQLNSRPAEQQQRQRQTCRDQRHHPLLIYQRLLPVPIAFSFASAKLAVAQFVASATLSIPCIDMHRMYIQLVRIHIRGRRRSVRL